MSPALGLMDHDSDDGLPVHYGPVAKTGGILIGDMGKLIEGFTGQRDGEVGPAAVIRVGSDSLAWTTC
jgi:hypothetical protein